MKSLDEHRSLKQVKELFKQQNIILYETNNQFEHYDLTNDKGIKIEVKNRRLNIEQFKKYANEGFILEKYKYDFLLGGLYINTFTFYYDYEEMDIIICWKIKDEYYDFIDKYMPRSTDFKGTYNKCKSITLLRPEAGKIFIKKDNWKCISYENLLEQLKRFIEMNLN